MWRPGFLLSPPQFKQRLYCRTACYLLLFNRRQPWHHLVCTDSVALCSVSVLSWPYHRCHRVWPSQLSQVWVLGHSDLPGIEADIVAAKAAALHAALVSGKVLAMMLANVFIVLFHLVASRLGWCSGKQIACGETICAGVVALLQSRQEAGSHTICHTRLTRGHVLSSLLWRISRWTAHVVPKCAISVVLTGRCPTRSVMSGTASLTFWLLYCSGDRHVNLTDTVLRCFGILTFYAFSEAIWTLFIGLRVCFLTIFTLPPPLQTGKFKF
jgi:hypothetical protein